MQPDYNRLARLVKKQDCVATREQLKAIGSVTSGSARCSETSIGCGCSAASTCSDQARQRGGNSHVVAQWAEGERCPGRRQQPVVVAARRSRGGRRRADTAATQGWTNPRNVVIHQPSRPVKTIIRDKVKVVCIEDALLGFAASCDDRREWKLWSNRRCCRTARRSARSGRQSVGTRSGVRGVALLRSDGHRPAEPSRSMLELEVLDLIRASDLPVPSRTSTSSTATAIAVRSTSAISLVEAPSKPIPALPHHGVADSRRRPPPRALGRRFRFV